MVNYTRTWARWSCSAHFFLPLLSQREADFPIAYSIVVYEKAGEVEVVNSSPSKHNYDFSGSFVPSIARKMCTASMPTRSRNSLSSKLSKCSPVAFRMFFSPPKEKPSFMVISQWRVLSFAAKVSRLRLQMISVSYSSIPVELAPVNLVQSIFSDFMFNWYFLLIFIVDKSELIIFDPIKFYTSGSPNLKSEPLKGRKRNSTVCQFQCSKSTRRVVEGHFALDLPDKLGLLGQKGLEGQEVLAIRGSLARAFLVYWQIIGGPDQQKGPDGGLTDPKGQDAEIN